MPERKVYSVSEINRYLESVVTNEPALKNIAIKGEVTGASNRGHIYFSLKDGETSIPCVIWRSSVNDENRKLLTDGKEVVVSGSIGFYQANCKVQLYVRTVKDAGEGIAALLREQLKQRLAAEGLFDIENKKPLPQFPRSIGIITSASGDAVKDIIKNSLDRNPYIQIYVYNTMVSGDTAVATMIEGLRTFDSMQDVDVIIIGRGGGAKEQLLAYDDERLVREIFKTVTPVVSATGHEANVPLIDLVADVRESTPTGAALKVVPDIMSKINEAREYTLRLNRDIMNKYNMHLANLMTYVARIEKLSPENQLKDHTQKLSLLNDRLKTAMLRKRDSRYNNYNVLIAKLDGLSPTSKLINGFGYIEHKDKPLTEASEVGAGDTITLTIKSGRIRAKVSEVEVNG